MNSFDIVQTTVHVFCPLDNQVRKVYTRSIPDKNLHTCNGCDFLNGSKVCNHCINTVISLLQEGKIQTSHRHSADFSEQSSNHKAVGTASNPLWLK